MAKKYEPKKVKLDAFEQTVEEAIDYDKLKKPSLARQAKLAAFASETLSGLKTARTNIRMNDSDMDAIRRLAEQAGMPYQTLIAHVLHLYVTDQLINIHEVKKMAEAGIFRKKSG